MDIELPTSDAAQRAFNPDYINFQNMRFSTYTALASTHGAECGVDTPCSEQEYQFAGVIPQNNGAYHTVRWRRPGGAACDAGCRSHHAFVRLAVPAVSSELVHQQQHSHVHG